MAELLNEIPLGGGLTKRVYDDGRVSVIDSDGRFVKHPDNTLPSDTAREVQSSRKVISRARLADDIDALLEELELDSSLDRQLASIFLRGGSAAITAAKELITRSRSYVAQPEPTPQQTVKLELSEAATKWAILEGWFRDPDEVETIRERLRRYDQDHEHQQSTPPTPQNVDMGAFLGNEVLNQLVVDRIEDEAAEAAESLRRRLESERARIRGAPTNNTGAG